MTDYIAAEPDVTQITRYVDQLGGEHETREAAIEANFYDDLYNAVCATCHQKDDPVRIIRCMKTIAARKPDLFRVLIGDRDAT